MSMLRGNTKFRPNPYLVEHNPNVYLSMGLDRRERGAQVQRVARRGGRLLLPQPPDARWLRKLPDLFKDDGIVPLEVEIKEVGDDGSSEA